MGIIRKGLRKGEGKDGLRRAHRCCGMLAPSLLSEGASLQLGSQTSSKHLKGRDEGWREEKDQVSPNGHVNSARESTAKPVQPSHLAAWGSWPTCPSPSGSGNCPRRRPHTCHPASESQPPCHSRRAGTQGRRGQAWGYMPSAQPRVTPLRPSPLLCHPLCCTWAWSPGAKHLSPRG